MQVAKYWRNKKLRYRLEGLSRQEARAIGTTRKPTIDVERNGRQGAQARAGEAAAVTVQRSEGSPLVKGLGNGPRNQFKAKCTALRFCRIRRRDFEAQAPYYLALVRLDGGELITAQLTDVERDIRIGEPVEMVTRKLTTDGARGIIVYGYKFRPLVK